MTARPSAFPRHISWCIRCSPARTSMSRAWRAIRPRGRAWPSAATCRYSPQDGSPSQQMAETRDLVTAANPQAEGDKLRAPYAMQRYVFVTDDKAEALSAAEAARYHPACGDVDAQQCPRGSTAHSCRRFRHPMNHRWRRSPAGWWWAMPTHVLKSWLPRSVHCSRCTSVASWGCPPCRRHVRCGRWSISAAR